MSKASALSVITRRLEGKVALITGGSSGIGKCTAKLFCKNGAKVVIADIQDELGQTVIQEIGQTNSTYIHCDVSSEDHIKNAVDKTVSKFGKLDIMFNNAGIYLPSARIIDDEKRDFEKVLSINVTGVFLGMKHAARVMIPKRSGTIISTASMVSKMGVSSSHSYTCSKHAVLGLTRNLAVELGQFGIRVNCLSPFAVPTPMTSEYFGLDEDEIGEAVSSMAVLRGVTLKTDDVANAALFLASDEAKYVSGQNLLIDGGFSITNSGYPTSNQG